MSFWAELGRRNVYKVGVAYAIVAWLLAQVASVFAPALSLPQWVTPFVVFLLILGFPIALTLAWAYEVTPEGIKRTRQVPLENSIRHVAGQKLNYIVTGLLVVAVGFIAADYYLLRDTPTENAAAAARVAEPTPAGVTAVDSGTTESARPIVAVLPFDNLSPNPDDAYFASGLHEEILHQLEKLDAIKVISRTSVMRYAENRPAIPQIAADLDADAVMEGSVRYAGDRILVTAQLIDPATDTHLWSQTYPGDLSDLEQIFAIQADIAMNVANALEAELSPEERTSLARIPTASRDAYELYLASIDAMRFDGARAMEQIERALELDPGFAEAWAQKARILATTQAGLPPDRVAERFANARRDALHAVELAPDSAAVRGYYAYVLTQQGEWSEARRAFDATRALGGDPIDQDLVFHQLSVADLAGAKASAQALNEKDPLNANALAFLLLSYGLLGESREEAETYAKGTTLFGDWLVGNLFEAYFALARRDLAQVRRITASSLPNLLRTMVGYIDTPEAGSAEVRRLSTQEGMDSNVARINLALWAAFFGDDELALDLFTAALEQSRTNTYYVWMPLLERARQRPAFKALLRDLGLVDYWREYGWPPICQPTQGDDFTCR
jgi:TolB-like protein